MIKFVFLLIFSGAVHCDDLVFIFYAPKWKNLPQPGSQDEQKLNEIIEMWTNFAKEGYIILLFITNNTY